MTPAPLPDISTCRQLANMLHRETGPLRPILADMLLQFARVLEEVPKMRRATETILAKARDAQASVNAQRRDRG